MAQQSASTELSGSPAENYERFFVPAIGAPAANGLMKAASITAGERVLDVACGTGVATRLALRLVGPEGSVAGLDLNQGMLAVARLTEPGGAAIEWHEGNAQAMPFADASFDVVLCQMGLQFMPDKRAALSEMHRVLVPGGRLVVNAPGPTPRLFEIMGDALARHVGPEAAGFVNHVFSLNDTSEVENLLSGAGFRDASVHAGTTTLALPAPREFLWQYLRSTPLAGALAKVDDERRSALEREVVEGWGEFVRDGVLVLEARMLVATARK